MPGLETRGGRRTCYGCGMDAPVLYYDLGSPYAYLAVERAAGVLGAEPLLQPVLLGAIFAHRGRGSWSQTPEREANIADIERRAQRYGVPPVAWPPGWPPHTPTARRAATFAGQQGRGREFAHAAFRAAFVVGEDLGDPEVVARVGREVGLDDVASAIAAPEVKQALRAATDDAIARGVEGVPSLRTGDRIVYGDDQLS